MKFRSKGPLLIALLALLVGCTSESSAPTPQETTSESKYKTTFDYLVVQGCLSFMAKDYQRASQLFSAIEALADFDAYDGYSTGILKERGNFNASRCY